LESLLLEGAYKARPDEKEESTRRKKKKKKMG